MLIKRVCMQMRMLIIVFAIVNSSHDNYQEVKEKPFQWDCANYLW